MIIMPGNCHTLLDENDISSTRHARAFVAGGAEHQRPDGGGPVALIVDRSRA
jgi:cyanuric acid amidohydrolase